MDKRIDEQTLSLSEEILQEYENLSPESKQRIEAQLDELRKEYARPQWEKHLLRLLRWAKVHWKGIFGVIVGIATIVSAIFAVLSFFK